MLSVHIFVQILGENLLSVFITITITTKKNIIEEGFPSPAGRKQKYFGCCGIFNLEILIYFIVPA